MLVKILGARFTADNVQSGINWERLAREYEAQTTHTVPDLSKCGIVISGIQESTRKNHLVLHSGRLRQAML
eukprot:2449600-Amphidinium_carterae.1